MGQTIAVDANLTDLKDFCRFKHVSTATPAKPRAHGLCAATVSTGHHIRAWKFDSHGPVVVDTPVSLSDERGMFNVELKKESSYLILHVKSSTDRQDTSDVANEALEELAACAKATCTPRGLAVDVASHHEQPLGKGADVAAGLLGPMIQYSVFVWNGLGADPFVKAHAMLKAWELDNALKRGLQRQPEAAERLRQGVPVKGVSRQSELKADPESQEGPQQPAGNRLLSAFLDRPPRKSPPPRLSWAPITPRADGDVRFPRLGASVSSSLPGGFGGGKEPQGLPASIPPMPPVANNSPGPQVAQKSPVLGRTPGAQGPTSGPKINGIIIPKLALGSLPNTAKQEGVRVAPGGTSNPMDVDDSSSGGTLDSCEVSSGRKRPRDPDAVGPAPLSARGSSATSSRGSPATPNGLMASPAVASARAPATNNPVGSLVIPQIPATARADMLPLQQQMPSISESHHHPPTTSGPGKLPIPSLNFAGLAQRQSVGNRSDVPAMLNLEEINVSQEELMASFDPDNDENNYHLPNHLYKQLQLKHFRAVCSEVIPGQLFISSYQVAGDLEVLRSKQITHIVNTAADICDSKFPEHFQYLTYYLKDTNSEDISLLFYRTLDWIQAAIDSGGKVLVHCREGVSRSATMVIAYLMWRYNLPFDAAHEQIRKVRLICNPNAGFTCQLLLLGKKLQGIARPTADGPQADKVCLLRVAPYHPKEAFLYLMPSEPPPGSGPLLDPRFGWVVQQGCALTLWLGSQVKKAQVFQETVEQHLRWLETFEKLKCSLTVLHEGQEPQNFWQALASLGVPTHGESRSLVGIRDALDADHEVIQANYGGCATVSFVTSAPPGAAEERHQYHPQQQELVTAA